MNAKLKTILLATLLVAAALFTAGCEDSEPTAKSTWVLEANANPSSVSLNPSAPVEVTITAVLFDENGTLQPGIGLRFTSDAGSMASNNQIIETNARGEAVDTLVLNANDVAQGDTEVKVFVKSGPAEGSATVVIGELLAPTASLTLSPSLQQRVGETVLFSGGLSEDLDGEIVLYTFVINSSNPDPGNPNPEVVEGVATGFNRTFVNAQKLFVSLTVTDNDGLTDTTLPEEYDIVANLPPVADAGPDVDTTIRTGETACPIFLDGCGSTDPDGHVTAWFWTTNTGTNDRYGDCDDAASFPPRTDPYTVTLTVYDNGDGSTSECNNPQNQNDLNACPTRLSDDDTMTVFCRPQETKSSSSKKK